MKVRNGFVSNSSSSSFIIIGVPSSTNIEEDDEQMEKTGLSSLYVEMSEYDYITGIVLCDSDDYLEESTTSFLELQKMAQKVADALNVDISEVKLMTGTRPC